jgi:hypothetical protein
MSDTDDHLYAIDSFSADRKLVYGPRELRQEDALAYLAQRLADQHRGSMSATYWTARARGILEEATNQPGVACIERVARGRGAIGTAAPVASAAAFEVRVFPLFEDEDGTEELIAAFEHPRLAVAMREAGVRADAWARIECEELRVAQERAPLVGFEAVITARLSTPLLPGRALTRPPEPDRETSHAPLGCGVEPEAAPISPAA